MKIYLAIIVLALIHTPILAADTSHSLIQNSNAQISGVDAAVDLMTGNQRYINNKSEHKNQNAERRKELIAGQKPNAIILSCSDSQVPPEVIFDKGLGEIFTIRTAGHSVNAHTVASIEYAIEHLGVRALIIMGHESCGAIKTALSVKEGTSAGSRDLDTLMASIRPNLKKFPKGKVDDPKLEAPVKAHVTAVTKELVVRSKIIREFIEKGELVIGNAIYRLDSGRVDFWTVGVPLLVGQEDKNSAKATAESERAEIVKTTEDTQIVKEKSKTKNKHKSKKKEKGALRFRSAESQ